MTNHSLWQYEPIRDVAFLAAAVFLIALAAAIYFCRTSRHLPWRASIAWGLITGLATDIFAYLLFFQSILDAGLRQAH
jgi:drug/metabolite transporter (DMT)-like permease